MDLLEVHLLLLVVLVVEGVDIMMVLQQVQQETHLLRLPLKEIMVVMVLIQVHILEWVVAGAVQVLLEIIFLVVLVEMVEQELHLQ